MKYTVSIENIGKGYSRPEPGATRASSDTRAAPGLWPVALVLAWLAAGAFALPPPLPEARANNPLVRVESDESAVWFSGLGITGDMTWRDLRADGWVYREGERGAWTAVPGLPVFEGLAGRLGSHAAAIAGSIHVIGGYTVAEDHSERSTPGIHRLELEPAPEWVRVATMPVPVDDAVALVHENRYLYLVSGWSDTGNVNLVQVWDSRENAWRQAEPWPGAPVFGHAGGLAGNRMVVCGGARIEYPVEGPRRFPESDECWLGTIRPDDRYRLDWRPLPPMPGGSRYRSAAAGAIFDGKPRVVFAGGSDRPYNYDGQGYDGVPAAPTDSVVSYSLDDGRWHCHEPMPEATMDHRGLVVAGGRLAIVGGMNGAREATADVRAFDLSAPIACP